MANSCPVCGSSAGILVWMRSKVRTHWCPKLKSRLYWKGSVFSVNPALLGIRDAGYQDAS